MYTKLSLYLFKLTTSNKYNLHIRSNNQLSVELFCVRLYKGVHLLLCDILTLFCIN